MQHFFTLLLIFYENTSFYFSLVCKVANCKICYVRGDCSQRAFCSWDPSWSQSALFAWRGERQRFSHLEWTLKHLLSAVATRWVTATVTTAAEEA